VETWLVACLGNPGKDYQGHRHSVGFVVGEELARRQGLGKPRAKYRGALWTCSYHGKEVLVLLPQTYMNLSGRSVVEAAGGHRIPIKHILAVHDDVELPFGEVRLKEGGGLGGHNGLRSMEQSLGSREFFRVRVGVGRPDNPRIDLADYVLSRFSEPAHEVRAMVARAADLVEEWLAEHAEITCPD